MPNSVQEALTAISPDLKTGMVLISLAILFFKIGSSFWDYEKEASKESIDKLKDVLGHFKDVYIRPILERKTYEWIESAYHEAIKSSFAHISVTVQGTTTKTLTVTEINDAFSAFNQATLLADLKSNDKVAEFYSSPSGVGLLDKLDANYLKARDYKKFYDKKISSCRNTMYLCYTLALLLFTCLGHLILPFSEAGIYFAAYSAFILFILGLINFIQFEVHRRKLVSTWEDLQTIGNLDA